MPPAASNPIDWPSAMTDGCASRSSSTIGETSGLPISVVSEANSLPSARTAMIGFFDPSSMSCFSRLPRFSDASAAPAIALSACVTSTRPSASAATRHAG